MFTMGVVATLAVGLGINAAVFRVADYVLFRPPPGVARASDLRRVEASITVDGGALQRSTMFSYPDAKRMVDSGAFEAAAIHTQPRLQRDDQLRDVGVAFVDAGYFPLLGVRMTAGRGFDRREGDPHFASGVAVVSFSYWQRALGGRPPGDTVLISIGEHRYRLIGVAAGISRASTSIPSTSG
jgi:hypothetical protein